MASGRAADREDPNNSKRRAARSLDRDPISALHQGQRSDAPHQRAGHMTAPDHFAETLLTSFAGGGRPHMNYALLPCTVNAMPKRSHHANMNSEEYLAAVIQDGKVFIRCDEAGTPCSTDTHWKIRDDLFALMQERDSDLDAEAAQNS
jgi:hypothetical protein